MERILVGDLIQIARSPELLAMTELVLDIVETSAHDADWVTIEKIADLYGVSEDYRDYSCKIARIKAAKAWFPEMSLMSAKLWVEANFLDDGHGPYAFNI